MGCMQRLIRFFYSVTARRRISMVEALGSAPTSKTKFQRRYGCRNLGGFETKSDHHCNTRFKNKVAESPDMVFTTYVALSPYPE